MDESFEDAQPPSPGISRVEVPRRSQPERNGRVERLPPHAPDAELGVIGCCLLSPQDALPIATAKLNANAEAFYDLRNQTIFANLLKMAESNLAGIDLITLCQRLRDLALLDEVGGPSYLTAAMDSVPSAANVTYYTEIVLEKFLLRKAIQACTEVVGRIYEDETDAANILDVMERDVLAVRRNVVATESFGMKELVPSSMIRMEAMYSGEGRTTGIATGFIDFDKMTNGLQNGEMIVLAARPSIGKTSLALNIADYVAVNNEIPVGIFSLEMTKESLTDRLISARGRINLRNLREGFLAERDFPRITGAAGQIQRAPLRIDDTPALSIMALRARARSMWQQYGIKLFIIDYLQLMHSTGRRAENNRQQEVSDISSGVKALAKELNLPVIVLSQLNRNVEREKNRRPTLADLRESGSIEQDADVVGLLYKMKREDDDVEEQADGIPVNLNIAKQRNGPVGDVALTFLKPYTRFESAARVSDDDAPAE